MPDFIDGLPVGSTRIGLVGWVLLAMFFALLLTGVWFVLSRDDET